MISIIDSLLSQLAPFDCLVCGCEGRLLCDNCLPDSLTPLDGVCYRCSQMAELSNLCDMCRPATSLRAVWLATAYNSTASQLLRRLKFERAQAAVEIIAQTLDQSLSYLPPQTIISHIPTANRRVRQRGYDQSELVARQLARCRGLPYRRLLIRRGQSRQVGASRQARQRQLRQAFVPLIGLDLRQASVVLIDDVLTTGATIEAAATALVSTGCPAISAALFAHQTKKGRQS